MKIETGGFQAEPHQLKLFTARTCGREKEYSVSSKRRARDGGWHQYDEAADAAQRILRTHSPYRTNQDLEFLCNGARLYDDHGKLEYATAECRSPLECALHDKAGDFIVSYMARSARYEGELLDVHNDNSDGLVSYGCHTSFQILRGANSSTLRRNLMTFLVSTGAVLFGAGEYRDGHFYHSSRAQFIDTDVGEKTRQGARAIINTRSEHLLPPPYRDYFTRLHITSLDAKVSDKAVFLEVALTWLLLSLSECGFDVSRYHPRHPVRALKDTSMDIMAPIETEDGQTVCALDVQEYLLGEVRAFLQLMEGQCELLDWMWEAVAMWEGAIHDLRTCSLEEWPESSYWIDWWAKLHMLQLYREENPCAARHLMTLFATQYHHVDAEKSLAQQMLGSGLMGTALAPGMVEQAAMDPSSHPRARRRAYWIRSHSPSQKVSQVRWEDVTVNGRTQVLEFD